MKEIHLNLWNENNNGWDQTTLLIYDLDTVYTIMNRLGMILHAEPKYIWTKPDIRGMNVNEIVSLDIVSFSAYLNLTWTDVVKRVGPFLNETNDLMLFAKWCQQIQYSHSQYSQFA